MVANIHTATAPSWTDAELTEAARLINGGMSIRGAAARMGRPETTLRQRVKYMGLLKAVGNEKAATSPAPPLPISPSAPPPEPTPQERFASDLLKTREQTERRQVDAAYKEAIAEVERLKARINVLTELSSRPLQEPLGPPTRSRGDATAILVLSDWHIEEPVEPNTVNGLNEFNLEIAEKRVNRVFEKALLLLDDARNLATIDELVVALLGDFFDSWLHEEAVETNSLAPLPAARQAADWIERGLRTLLAHSKVDRIIVPTAFGNHGRMTKKMRNGNGADTSLEHNAYLELAKRFQGESRLYWKIGEGYHNCLDIQGRLCRFHHGHNVKYQGGIGGLAIPTAKAIFNWNTSRPAYADFFGHHHTWFWGWNFVANGSLIGYNSYAVAIKAPYQPPMQTFALIDNERGLTRVLPIFCE